MDNAGPDGTHAVVTGAAAGLGGPSRTGSRAGAAIVAVDLPGALEGRLPAGWRAEALDLGADDAQARLAALADDLGRSTSSWRTPASCRRGAGWPIWTRPNGSG
jgi:hypothetical protein